MMILSELVNTPDGGLTAGFAAFLGGVFMALSHMISAWVNKKRNTSKDDIITGIAEQLDPKNETSLVRKMETFEKELKSNGGQSLKDMVVDTNKILKSHGDAITEIKENLQVLNSQARARTELALDQSLTAQFLCDEKGLVTFANDAMSEMFGLGKTHLLKNKWMIAVDNQEVREDFVKRLDFALSRGLNFSMPDIPIRKQRTEENIVYMVKITIEPMNDSRGSFLWNIGKIREIKSN